MNSRKLIGLLLLVCGAANAAELRVAECRGAHGERVFSDRAHCASERIREWILAAPPASPSPAPPASSEPDSPRHQRRGSGLSTARADQRESYRCSTPSRTWYQHTPCRAGAGRGKQRETVKQTRVSRVQACREIDRPAALLRRGSQQDQRAGPYEKATGRDPCR